MAEAPSVAYSSRERFWLWVVAAVSFAGVNGAFIYGLVARPDAFASALGNPLAAAFMAEALVLVALLAYLLRRWRLSRLHWGWFVVLSLAGSLAFSLPVTLLFGARSGPSGGKDEKRAETKGA